MISNTPLQIGGSEIKRVKDRQYLLSFLYQMNKKDAVELGYNIHSIITNHCGENVIHLSR
jgi:hypothetical protein